MDAYLKQQASQDLKRRAAVAYVMTAPEEPGRILGYYTLSAASVQLSDVAEKDRKKLARYPEVPASLVGRLAVDERQKGRGLGGILLRDALLRSLEQSRRLALAVVIVDALHDRARAFYEHYGFLPLEEAGRRLYLPIATIEQAQ